MHVWLALEGEERLRKYCKLWVSCIKAEIVHLSWGESAVHAGLALELPIPRVVSNEKVGACVSSEALRRGVRGSGYVKRPLLTCICHARFAGVPSFSW
jgi:hypothetical protein